VPQGAPNWESKMKKSILALTAALAVSFAAGGALAAGDAEAGKAEFKKCAACHAVGEGATNRVGPVLNDVFGRVAGTFEGYKYSQAMVDAGAGGLVWTPETMAKFLHKPKDFVPGTKMSFAGLAKEDAIANLEAYLLTLSPNYVPEAPADGASSEASSARAQ
jgi:cytochrome c